MKREKVLGLTTSGVLTASGPKTAIGNARHQVGDYVWTDGRYVFGHEPVKNKPAFIPLPSLEGFIEINTSTMSYNLRSIAEGFPILLSEPINVPEWNGGYLVYDQNNVALMYFNDIGVVTVKRYVDGVSETYTVNLPNNAPIRARDAYFDDNGDLIWAIFLWDTDPLECKIIHYQNATQTAIRDFTQDIQSLKDAISAESQEESRQYMQTIPLTLKNETSTYTELAGSKWDEISRSNRVVVGAKIIHNPYAEIVPDDFTDISQSISLLSVNLWDKVINLHLRWTGSLQSIYIKTITLFGPFEAYPSEDPPVPYYDTSNEWIIFSFRVNRQKYIEIGSASIVKCDKYTISNDLQHPYYYNAVWVDVGDFWEMTSMVDTMYLPYFTTAVLEDMSYSIELKSGFTMTQIPQETGPDNVVLSRGELSINVSQQSNYYLDYSNPPLAAEKNGTIIFYTTSGNALYRIKDGAINFVHYNYLYNIQIPVIRISKQKFKSFLAYLNNGG